MRKRLLWWILVAAWCAMIFSITSSPAATSKNTRAVIKSEMNASADTVDKMDAAVRKTAHVALFGVLALLLLAANWGIKHAPIIAWLLATFYGATDEIHQIFEPGRTPSVRDVWIDSWGAAAALVIFYLIKIRMAGRHSKRLDL